MSRNLDLADSGSRRKTLARKAGEEVPDEMTKAEASMKIDELRERTGVGEPPKKRKARKD